MEEMNNNLLEEDNKKVEIEYTKAKLSRRFLAFLIDSFLIIFTAFIFYAGVNMGVQNSQLYSSCVNTMKDLEVSSELFILKDDQEVYISSYVDLDDITGNENKKNFISNKLNNFYHNPLFFDDGTELEKYNQRKLTYKDNNEPLFEFVAGEVKEIDGIDPFRLLNFYKFEANNHAIGYLVSNIDYADAQRTIFIISVVIIVASSFVSFLVYVLILPLTVFKRGRQTIGMKINKIAYISVVALNITSGKYVGRSFFSYFFYFIMNFFGFLIPMVVTFTMMFTNKTSQTLTEYLFNDYVVSVENQDIYLNYFEYLDRQNKPKLVDIQTNSKNIL